MSEKDIYEQLREKIDGYSVGLYPTESGKEIKILQRLFTEEEAKVFLAMDRTLQSAKAIAENLDFDENYTAQLLSNMTQKGLTFPKTKDGIKYYAATPFMHGFFEHQGFRPDEDKELAVLIEDYLLDGFVPRSDSLRTVPVGVDLTATEDHISSIMPYDDVKRIIENKEKIGLFKCACSLHLETLDKGCERPQEVCLAFDFYAEYAIEELGAGRWISREEALEVLKKAENSGLVHHVGDDLRNTECICNCCPDCCTILRLLKRLPQPAMFKSSNYYPEIDHEQCTQCLICTERCPMEAMAENDEAGNMGVEINRDRCIGCGLCATACPENAIKLNIKDESKIKGPRKQNKFMRSSIDFENDISG